MDETLQDQDTTGTAGGALDVVVVDEVPPTLAAAFTCVRAALEGAFEDNLPVLEECRLMQALYNDGNVGVAWRRAVLLLEQAVNAPLRQ